MSKVLLTNFPFIDVHFTEKVREVKFEPAFVLM